jgi:6-pyruvoyltetrahydropterin/6-carboxytetrahydropterin synthase
MYEISKDFHLSYAHHLTGLADGHPCSRPHGHNAVVRVTLEAAELNEDGFVLDYNDLKPLGDWLDLLMDHQDLNEIVSFQPSAENLARFVYDFCAGMDWPVVAVGWSETPKTWAVYRP